MVWIVVGLIVLVGFSGLLALSSVLSSPNSSISLHEDFLVQGRNTCQTSLSYLQIGGLEPPVSVVPTLFRPELVTVSPGRSRADSVIEYKVGDRSLEAYLTEPSSLLSTTPIFVYLYDFHQTPTSIHARSIVDEMTGRGFIVVVPKIEADPYLIDSTNYYLSISASSYQEFVVRDLVFLLEYLNRRYSYGAPIVVYGQGWGSILGSLLVYNSPYPSVLMISLPIVDPNRYFLQGGPVTLHPRSEFSRVYFGTRQVSFKCSAGYLSYFTYLHPTPVILVHWGSSNELESLGRILEEQTCSILASNLRDAVEKWSRGVNCSS